MCRFAIVFSHFPVLKLVLFVIARNFIFFSLSQKNLPIVSIEPCNKMSMIFIHTILYRTLLKNKWFTSSMAVKQFASGKLCFCHGKDDDVFIFQHVFIVHFTWNLKKLCEINLYCFIRFEVFDYWTNLRIS